MIHRLGLVTCLSLGFACSRGQPVKPTPGPGDASGPLEIEWGDRLLRPSEVVPQPGGGGPYEPSDIGWSKHTGEFMFCVDSLGSDCAKLCDFQHPGGEREYVTYGDAPPEPDDLGEEEKICDQPMATFEQRLAAGEFRIEDGNWAHGADVVLVVEQTQSEPDDDDGPHGVVRIGARLRSESASVAWVETVEECDEGYCAPDLHIDAIAPSPDGQTIAVLMHSFAGEFTDTYPLRLLDANKLADAAHGR